MLAALTAFFTALFWALAAFYYGKAFISGALFSGGKEVTAHNVSIAYRQILLGSIALFGALLVSALPSALGG
jgi:hypothetical protein